MSLKHITLSGAAFVALLGAAVAIAGPAAATPGIHPDDTGVSSGGAASAPAPADAGNTGGAVSAPASAPAPDATQPAQSGAAETAPAAPQAAAPAAPTANPASETTVVDLPDAAQTIASAPVHSQDGTQIGTVKSVKVGADGKPEQIKIDLGGNRTLGLAASDVSFDASNKVVIATLSQSEIMSLAAAQKQTH